MCDFPDFENEVVEKHGPEFLHKLNSFIETALEKNEGVSIEIGSWEVYSYLEKHDSLNYSYHFEAYNREEEDVTIDFTFYTGIDVGCELVHYSLEGQSLKHSPKTIDVLVDLKPDWPKYPDANETKKNLITTVLNSHKDKIMDIYQKQDYDNYVTGGGTVKTQKYYEQQFNKYKEKGLHWICVYEQEEVYPNFH